MSDHYKFNNLKDYFETYKETYNALLRFIKLRHSDKYKGEDYESQEDELHIEIDEKTKKLINYVKDIDKDEGKYISEKLKKQETDKLNKKLNEIVGDLVNVDPSAIDEIFDYYHKIDTKHPDGLLASDLKKLAKK